MQPAPGIKASRYFLQEHLHTGTVYHGGIGNKDIEKILLREGYTPILFPAHDRFDPIAKARRLLHLRTVYNSLPATGTIVFQVPLYTRMHKILLALVRRNKPGMRCICYLTDINGIKDGNERLLRKELHFYSRFREFIVHNETMKAWLLQHLPHANIGVAHFFDFLTEPSSAPHSVVPSVAFAGNLAKSGFVQELYAVKGLQFHIYGEDTGLPGSPTVQYEGCFEPYALPEKLKGSFGLVWDGESASGLEGPLGNYARYITPHKVGLYILAGIPCICHTDSAAGKMARETGFGFTVDKISDIPARISGIETEDYERMVTAARALAPSIAAGLCLTGALQQLDTQPAS